MYLQFKIGVVIIILLVLYLAEMKYEIHIKAYLLLNICVILISITFWFTNKFFLIKLTLGIFLRYSYNLGKFHPDILIGAILI